MSFCGGNSSFRCWAIRNICIQMPMSVVTWGGRQGESYEKGFLRTANDLIETGKIDQRMTSQYVILECYWALSPYMPSTNLCNSIDGFISPLKKTEHNSTTKSPGIFLPRGKNSIFSDPKVLVCALHYLRQITWIKFLKKAQYIL